MKTLFDWRRMKLPRLLVALFTLLGCGACAGKDTCFECHLVMEGMSVVFTNDIHFTNQISCSACHGGDATETNMNISMNASRGFKVRVTRQGIPEFCARCHSNSNFMGSVRPATARGPVCQIHQWRSRQVARSRPQAGGRVCGLPRHPPDPSTGRPALNSQSAAYFQDLRQMPCLHRRGLRQHHGMASYLWTSAGPAARSATPAMTPSRPPRRCSPVPLPFVRAATGPGLRPRRLAEEMEKI